MDLNYLLGWMELFSQELKLEAHRIFYSKSSTSFRKLQLHLGLLSADSLGNVWHINRKMTVLSRKVNVNIILQLEAFYY